MSKKFLSPDDFKKEKKVNTYALGALLELEGNDVFPFLELIEAHKKEYEEWAEKNAQGKVIYPTSLGIFDENDTDPNSKTGQDAWQKCRADHLVTGSKAGEFLGLCEYSSPREEIAKYVGAHGGENPFKVEEKINPEVARRGHMAEPIVADTAIRHIRNTVDPNAEMYFDPGIYEDAERPWISFSPDRILFAQGHFSYLEIKSFDVNSPNWYDWVAKGKIPPLYFAQLALGMHVLNLPDAYIACKASWGPRSFVILHVWRNKDFEEGMMARLDECWDFAKNGLLPESDWGGVLPEQIIKVFFREYGTPKPSSSRKSSDFDDPDGKLEEIIRKGIAITEEIEAKKRELEEAEQRLEVCGVKLMELTDHFTGTGKIATEEGEPDLFFTIKTSSHQTGKFDEDAFKAECPDEYRRCFSEPSFSKTLANKLFPHLVKQYTGPTELNVDGKEKVTCTFYEGKQ